MTNIKASRKRTIGQAGDQQEELTHVLDDSLLPSADEIERLHQLDQNILPWLKTIAEKEQDFRHEQARGRLALVTKGERGVRQINKYGLTLSFVFLICGLVASTFLLYCDKTLMGSIFGGVTIVVGASILAGRKMPKNKEQDSPPKKK